MIPENDEPEDDAAETPEEARASLEEDLERDRKHDDLEWGWGATIEESLRAVILRRGGDPDCAECRAMGSSMGPSHRGALRCESGSLASGGETAHCSCGVCF